MSRRWIQPKHSHDQADQSTVPLPLTSTPKPATVLAVVQAAIPPDTPFYAVICSGMCTGLAASPRTCEGKRPVAVADLCHGRSNASPASEESIHIYAFRRTIMYAMSMLRNIESLVLYFVLLAGQTCAITCGDAPRNYGWVHLHSVLSNGLSRPKTHLEASAGPATM